jgi:hypothetical protein
MREKRGSYRRRRELTSLERDKIEATNAKDIRLKAELFISNRLNGNQAVVSEVRQERKIWIKRTTQPLPSLSSILLHHTAYLAGLALKDIKAEHKDDYMPENGEE